MDSTTVLCHVVVVIFVVDIFREVSRDTELVWEVVFETSVLLATVGVGDVIEVVSLVDFFTVFVVEGVWVWEVVARLAVVITAPVILVVKEAVPLTVTVMDLLSISNPVTVEDAPVKTDLIRVPIWTSVPSKPINSSLMTDPRLKKSIKKKSFVCFVFL